MAIGGVYELHRLDRSRDMHVQISDVVALGLVVGVLGWLALKYGGRAIIRLSSRCWEIEARRDRDTKEENEWQRNS